MIESLDKNKCEKVINLSQNRFIVLLNFFDLLFENNKIEAERNIFLIDSIGHIIWRVNSENSVQGGFVDVSYSEGKLKAIGWNTGLYSIDEKTGFATPEMLLK
jgi:hypothetical protein